jgi:hypothetical protein
MSKTERLGTGQHVLDNQGPGFLYMKLGETREVQVLFMKPGRLEQGHCFPGIEVLPAGTVKSFGKEIDFVQYHKAV